MEGRDASAGDLGARCPGTPPLGDRDDGIAAAPRPGEPAPPRRRDRQPSGRRVRDGDGRARLLAPGRLRLRLCPDQDEPPVRGWRGSRRGRHDHARAVPGRRLSEPRRLHHRARDAAGLLVRRRVRIWP